MTALLDSFLEVLSGWRAVFPQFRTYQRGVFLALSQVLTPGSRTISRLIACAGRHLEDWTAQYRLFSRSQWSSQALFDPVIEESVALTEQLSFIPIAGDFTHLQKSGRHIPHVHCMRDPLSPPFHVNLIYGLRFFQLSCLIPLYKEGDQQSPPRSLPVSFEEVPVLPKPGSNATEEEKQQYLAEQKKRPSSQKALECLKALRARFDAAGVAAKKLLVALDGSFCNRVFFTPVLDRIELICRCRKDTPLCVAAPKGSGRFYAKRRFTPEQVMRDKRRKWKTLWLFHGGAWRELRYKEVAQVYWPTGAKRRPLRLFVLAPTAYHLTKNGKRYYRQPAFLLTTDPESPAEVLLQTYLDRWQIEVNHREEKTTFGVGDAQVRNEHSVARQPAFAVAVYSMLLLAALKTYGPKRSEAYQPLPKWRRNARRPSCQDIVDQLRREMNQAPEKLVGFKVQISPVEDATLRAAA